MLDAIEHNSRKECYTPGENRWLFPVRDLAIVFLWGWTISKVMGRKGKGKGGGGAEERWGTFSLHDNFLGSFINATIFFGSGQLASVCFFSSFFVGLIFFCSFFLA